MNKQVRKCNVKVTHKCKPIVLYNLWVMGVLWRAYIGHDLVMGC